jgi:hypothetical protein
VDEADGGDDQVQPIEAILHTLDGGDLQGGGLVTLASASANVPDGAGGRVEFAFDADVPAQSQLVVEIRVPDGEDSGDGFTIGANDDGQSAPAFIRAPACGDEQPSDISQIGFPDVHIPIEVSGQ